MSDDNIRVNAVLDDPELIKKWEKVKDFTEEKKRNYGKAESVRTAIRVAYKKIEEWEKKEKSIVQEDYKKLKNEIEKTIEGKK